MSGCPFASGSDVTPGPPHTEALLGFHTTEQGFLHGNKPNPTHYATYIGVPTLLNLQSGEAACKPDGSGLMHHEELTFIIVHQVFELWFKLVIADVKKSRAYLQEISDLGLESPAAHGLMTLCLNYLRRTETIFNHATGAFAVMETMHPADFIEFRDFLVPASGFQSVQFRVLEQLLGVQDLARSKVNGTEVMSYLQPDEQQFLAGEAKISSVNDIVEDILANLTVPASFIDEYIATTRKVLSEQQFGIARADPNDPKALQFVENGVQVMIETLREPHAWSEGLIIPPEREEKYRAAVVAALFVSSYRAEPKFSMISSLLDALVAVEEGTLLWRSRHMHMAERMIGRRSGTGGTSSGVGYLNETRKYRIFHALWLVRKLFVRASALPPLASLK